MLCDASFLALGGVGGDRVVKLLHDFVFRVIKKLKLNSRSWNWKVLNDCVSWAVSETEQQWPKLKDLEKPDKHGSVYNWTAETESETAEAKTESLNNSVSRAASELNSRNGNLTTETKLRVLEQLCKQSNI